MSVFIILLRKRGRGMNNEKIPIEAINTQPPPWTDDSIIISMLVSLHRTVSCGIHKKPQEKWAQDYLPSTVTLILAPQTLLLISMCCDLKLTGQRWIQHVSTYVQSNVCQVRNLNKSLALAFLELTFYTPVMSSLVPFLTTFCLSPPLALSTIIPST